MTEGTVLQPDGRHQVFEAARRAADWTISELWISHLALGGSLFRAHLKDYLRGLIAVPPGQQDMLACALNERLADLSEPLRVSYVTVLPEDRFGVACVPGRELIFERF